MILLARGAEQEMKDRKDCKAIGFAIWSESNTEERHSRVGGVHIEDAIDANKHRKATRRMLDSQNLTTTAPFDLSNASYPSYDSSIFHRSSTISEVILWVLFVKLPIRPLRKRSHALSVRGLIPL